MAATPGPDPAPGWRTLLAPAGADGQPTEALTLLVDPTLNPALQLAFRNQTSAALARCAPTS